MKESKVKISKHLQMINVDLIIAKNAFLSLYYKPSGVKLGKISLANGLT